MTSEQVKQSLLEKGVVTIPSICDTAHTQLLLEAWKHLSQPLCSVVDFNHCHILLVFESASQGAWPPGKGEVWPGYKQKTDSGNLVWLTTEQVEMDYGSFYKIELQGERSVSEYIFYPNEALLRPVLPVIEQYQSLEREILCHYFVNHHPTFCSFTYVSGSASLPRHNDGQSPLETSRIVHTIQNQRDHSLFMNEEKFLSRGGESYLLNAFLPHEIKEAEGARLTISSCIVRRASK